MPTFWEKLDKAGWSAWFIQYEKAEGEGEKMVPFENLLDGFVQRMESIGDIPSGLLESMEKCRVWKLEGVC